MQKKFKDLLIGSDPELFLIDYSGEIVPASNYIIGNKENPEKITDEGHAIQYDNVMVEYNIPPCKTSENWIKEHNFVLDYIKETIAEPENLSLLIVASKDITPEVAENPIAQVFGCDPDFNAWSNDKNVVSRDYPLLRTCGGHIHLGSRDIVNEEVCKKLIQAMDLYLSIPLVLLEPDSMRKRMYGRAGAYRYKQLKNGIGIAEYRSASNFWLSSNDMMKFAFDQAQIAVNFVASGGIITNPNDIIEAINSNNGELAKEIMEDYNIVVPQLQIN